MPTPARAAVAPQQPRRGPAAPAPAAQHAPAFAPWRGQVMPRPAEVLAMQRAAGNGAVQRMLAGGRAPGAVQRAVDTRAARKDNKYFAQAEKVVLEAIAMANGELWQMINDDNWQVDLVFRSDLGLLDGVGEARPMAFYADESRKGRIEDLMHDGVELKNERITIEIQVVPPVLSFWDRSAGQAAGTIAHEYSIHAERYAKIIKHIRAEGSVGKAVLKLNEWADEGEFDPETHHESIFTADEHTQRYAALVEVMKGLFLKAGMKDEAVALAKAFDEDITEHRMQAKFGKKKQKAKPKPSWESRFRQEMEANHAAILEAKAILATLPPAPPLPTIVTLEDMIENA